jgi:ribokinase
MIVVAGSLNMDFVGRVQRLPAWGETALGTDFATFDGGKGGNQAVAAARLGAQVAFAGAVGNDAFGAALVLGLQREGIATDHVVRVAAATGCALIHVGPDGDNAITVLPGANQSAPPPPVAWPAAWQLLMLQLELPLATVLAWATAARRGGATVLLNAAPMSPLSDELLQQIDGLVVNEIELRQLVGPCISLDRAVEAAARRGPSAVIVTLGADGYLARVDGQVLRGPGHAVTVVDSTGAGDCFVGALAAGLWQQRSWAEALRRANAAAALSCTQPGARGGMPCADALDRWPGG